MTDRKSKLRLVADGGLPWDRRWTSARRDACLDYVRACARAARLADWTIDIAWDDPAAADELATMVDTYGQRRAILRFGPQFLDQSPQDQRDTVVHELIHLHLAGLHQNVTGILDALCDPVVGDALQATHHQWLELSIDALADAFGQLMPLPSWE